MRRCRGFSLAELLVAVGILAILGVIAMPSFAALMQTYRLNAATLQLANDLRYAQSLAVSNGASYKFHWGNDRNPPKPNTYRVEKKVAGACGAWPCEGDTMISNANVITNWTDIGVSYPAVTLSDIINNSSTRQTGVVFNSHGSLVDPLTSAPLPNPPVTLSVSSADGTTKTIQVRRTGSVKVL